jgi:hypothetical protein
MTLDEFLRRRLDEEVVLARRSLRSASSLGPGPDDGGAARRLADAVLRRGLLDGAAVLEREGRAAYADATRRKLALGYADHLDYRTEWSPAALVE